MSESESGTYLAGMVRRHSHDGLADPGLHFVLENAEQAMLGQAPWLEIGTYKGNTAVALLELLSHHYRAGEEPMLFTVDPHGGKPYNGGSSVVGGIYPDELNVIAKQNLARFQNHAHFRMTGLEFLKRVVGTPYWQSGQKRLLDGFAFVFLDGDHDTETVMAELHWLRKYCMKEGGRIVIDNVDMAHMLIRRLEGQGAVLGPETTPGARQALVVC